MTFQEEMQAVAEPGIECFSYMEDCYGIGFEDGARAALNSTLVKELERCLSVIDTGDEHFTIEQSALLLIEIQDALKALRDARGEG